MTTKIPKRIASTVLNSLKGGVVPRVGLPYVAVGREAEIDALLHDVDTAMMSTSCSRASISASRPTAT